MPAKRAPPPPPKRLPSPRRAASRQSSGLILNPSITRFNVPLRYAATAAQAQKLQGHRDDISDIKIALLKCNDTFENMTARQKQWGKITNNQGSGAVAMDALSFHAKSLAAIDENEREQDRTHSTMPEMTAVLLQIEQARRDNALRQQAAHVQQQWAQTSGHNNNTLMDGSGGPSSQWPPTQALVNPYSVVPSQRAMQEMFGNNGNSRPAASNAPSSQGGRHYQQPPTVSHASQSAPPSYSQQQQQQRPQYQQQYQQQQYQQQQYQQQQQRPPTYSYANSTSYPVNSTMYGTARPPQYPPPQQQQLYPQSNNTGAMYQAL